jgi:hypothetical protein
MLVSSRSRTPHTPGTPTTSTRLAEVYRPPDCRSTALSTLILVESLPPGPPSIPTLGLPGAQVNPCAGIRRPPGPLIAPPYLPPCLTHWIPSVLCLPPVTLLPFWVHAGACSWILSSTQSAICIVNCNGETTARRTAARSRTARSNLKSRTATTFAVWGCACLDTVASMMV